MFNFPKCPKCGNTLPIATGVCASCPISPLPGQEDQSARLAASAEVGQVEGTTLAQFEAYVRQRLDQNKACFGVSNPARQDFMTEVDRCKPFVVQIKLCEAVLDLIDEFKWGEA